MSVSSDFHPSRANEATGSKCEISQQNYVRGFAQHPCSRTLCQTGESEHSRRCGRKHSTGNRKRKINTSTVENYGVRKSRGPDEYFRMQHGWVGVEPRTVVSLSFNKTVYDVIAAVVVARPQSQCRRAVAGPLVHGNFGADLQPGASNILDNIKFYLSNLYTFLSYWFNFW